MNSRLWFVFAADLPVLPGSNRNVSSPGHLMSDLMLVLGIGLIIAALLFLGVWFLKKPANRNYSSPSSGEDSSDDSDGSSRRRKKKKRMRRDHRPRNPTLAETGGLPPPKNGSSPEIEPL